MQAGRPLKTYMPVNKPAKSRYEQPRNAKMTEDQIREIRAKFGETALEDRWHVCTQLAQEYNVQAMAVFRIITYQSWKHII